MKHGVHYRLFLAAAVFSCLASSGGCALTSKGDALSPRYFSPEPSGATRSAKVAAPHELRLGEVSAAAHLDDRIAYRVSAAEMGFYDGQRWTENPDAYLRRALERDLFEDRGLSRIVAGQSPILDVELTVFEELRGKPSRARVSLTFLLRDDRRSYLQRTIALEKVVERKPGADAAQCLAETLTAALDDAVRQLGDEVVAKLTTALQPNAP